MAEQRDNRKRMNNREDDGLNSKLIAVNRVTKVVKKINGTRPTFYYTDILRITFLID